MRPSPKERIRRSALIKMFLVFLSLASCLLYLMSWIQWVEPFPDRDSINQFYYPLRNYLFASVQLENNFAFLKELASSEYPRGLMFLGWVLSSAGLQSLILSHPWLLQIFLCLPFFVIALLCVEKRGARYGILLPVLLFFFPPLHLHWKNYSLHSFCLFYFLAAVLLMRRFEEEGEHPANYLIPGIFFWVSIVMKHLGLVLFLCYALSEWVYRLLRAQNVRNFLVFCFSLVLLASPLYPVTGLQEYFFHSLRHNMDLSPIQFLSVFSLALSLIPLSILFLKSTRSRRFEVSENFWLLSMGVQVSWLIYVLSLGSDFHRVWWVTGTSLFFLLLILSFLIGYGVRHRENREVLFLLFLYLLACLLYFSRVGQVLVLFLAPLSWTFLLWLQSCERVQRVIGAIVLCFLFTNFFPSLETLERKFGKYAFYVYSRGFNTLDMNPFSWKKSTSVASREKLKLLLEPLDFPSQEILVSYSNLHLHSALHLIYPDQLEYKIPNMLTPQSLKDDELQEMYQALSENMDREFDSMSRNGVFSLLFWRTKSWQDYLVNPGRDFHSKVPAVYDRMQFCFWIHQAFWRFLVRTKTLDRDYRMEVIRTGEIQTYVYIHRSIPFRRSMQEHEQSHRFSKLRRHFRHVNKPKVRRAHELFLLSNRYLDENNFLYASILLREAQRLNPSHSEVIKDLRVALRKLNSIESSLLAFYPTKDLSDAIVKTGALPFQTEQLEQVESLIEQAGRAEWQDLQKALSLYQEAWEWGSEVRILPLWMERLKLISSVPRSQSESSLLNFLKQSPRTSLLSAQEQLSLKDDELSSRVLRLLEMEEEYFNQWKEEIDENKGLNALQLERLEEENEILGDLKLRLSEDYYRQAKEQVSTDPSKAQVWTGIANSILENKGELSRDYSKDLELEVQYAKDNQRGPESLAREIAQNIYRERRFWGYSERDRLRIEKAGDSEQHLVRFLFEKASTIFESEPQDASRILALVLELDPEHSDANRDYQEVTRILEEAKLKSGSKAQALFLESTKYFESDPGRAIQLLEEALKEDPEHKEALEDLKILKAGTRQ